MHLFLDLDGTLLDFSDRLYTMYRDLLHIHDLPCLSKQDYWPLKQANLHERDIIAHTGASAIEDWYLEQRTRRLEWPRYQATDTLIPGVRKLLEQLQRDHTLSIVTLRQDRRALEWQLSSFRLNRYFAHVQSGRQPGEAMTDAKTRMIQEIRDGNEPGVMIGDSDLDIIGGKGAGVWTVGVESGVRNNALLETYHPDHIIPDVTHLPPVLARLECDTPGAPL